MHPLEALGLPEAAAEIYLALVEGGPRAARELAADLGQTSDVIADALVQLAALRLVEAAEGPHAPGTLTACPPRTALDALAEQRTREAGALRETADALSRHWRYHHTDDGGYLEIVRTSAGVDAFARRIQDEAVSRVRALSIGPSAPLKRPPQVADGALEAMARGVEYRVVYGAQVLHHPLAREAIQTCVQHGEQARVFPGVALNMMICDDRFAFVGVPQPGGEGRHALLVQPSALLDGLVGVFDSYWRMAVPLPASSDFTDGEVTNIGTGATDGTRQLLTYLSAGLTDESIARELGVSDRTVSRRIARLQETLGAQTRFQLGVQASRRGWL